MLKELAKQFHKELLALPADEKHLEDFAKQIINQLFDEIEQNTNAVVWNGGCNSVVFMDLKIDGKSSIKTIKERYVGYKNDKDD